MIGRFHEVSVHAPDVLESIAFYEKLGFTQVTAGEAWPYPYAVLADGRLAIGLHGRELAQSRSSPSCCRTCATGSRRWSARGSKFADRRLGDDVFNEASLEIAGQVVRLLEARTHSPSPQGPGETSRLGWFEEIALPAADFKLAQGRLGAARLRAGRGRRGSLSSRRAHERLAERRVASRGHAPATRARLHRRRNAGEDREAR
jgi:catechol 2,3-dioxygenase-like lactoylglutathione lyase family enzyme